MSRASDVQLRMKRQAADLLTAGADQVAVYVFGLGVDPELRMVDEFGTVFPVGTGSSSSTIWRPLMVYDADNDRFIVVTTAEGDAIMVGG